jgi:hypothetical protein
LTMLTANSAEFLEAGLTFWSTWTIWLSKSYYQKKDNPIKGARPISRKSHCSAGLQALDHLSPSVFRLNGKFRNSAPARLLECFGHFLKGISRLNAPSQGQFRHRSWHSRLYRVLLDLGFDCCFTHKYEYQYMSFTARESASSSHSFRKSKSDLWFPFIFDWVCHDFVRDSGTNHWSVCRSGNLQTGDALRHHS